MTTTSPLSRTVEQVASLRLVVPQQLVVVQAQVHPIVAPQPMALQPKAQVQDQQVLLLKLALVPQVQASAQAQQEAPARLAQVLVLVEAQARLEEAPPSTLQAEARALGLALEVGALMVVSTTHVPVEAQS